MLNDMPIFCAIEDLIEQPREEMGGLRTFHGLIWEDGRCAGFRRYRTLPLYPHPQVYTGDAAAIHAKDGTVATLSPLSKANSAYFESVCVAVRAFILKSRSKCWTTLHSVRAPFKLFWWYLFPIKTFLYVKTRVFLRCRIILHFSRSLIVVAL
ncbi:MAG: hypothetical protein GXP11_06745 [Gammaproteobacteria bacterium]|nr:hypothetical protein [Gammaproteobacteria bacterium]